jgi:hypothetical protein
MSKDILELSNSIVYNGVMKHANVGVASQQVEYKIQVNSMLTWLEGLKQNNVTFLKCDKVILNIDLKER